MCVISHFLLLWAFTSATAQGHSRNLVAFIIPYIYLLLCVLVCWCLSVCVRVSDPLELELQTVVSCHMGAGNWTQQSRQNMPRGASQQAALLWPGQSAPTSTFLPRSSSYPDFLPSMIKSDMETWVSKPFPSSSFWSWCFITATVTLTRTIR